MLLLLCMSMFIMAMTARASTNYATLKQSLGTAMYQAARDVAYDQSMDFSDLLVNYEKNKDKVDSLYESNFEARLVSLLPDGAKDLKIKYYNVDASKGLLDCEASYEIKIWGEWRTVSDHETVIIEKSGDNTTVSITFDPNGGYLMKDGVKGTGVWTRTMKTYQSLDISAEVGTAQRDGYEFLGGYDSPRGGNRLDRNVIEKPNYSMTYYAHWVSSSHDITYNLNGGHFETDDYPSTFADVATKDVAIPAPVKAGCTFTGWSGTDIDGIKKDVTIPKGTTKNLAFEAHWNEIKYTATVDLNGGKFKNSAPLTYNYTVSTNDISIPDPIREGYTFDGWDRSDGKTDGVIAKGTSQNITFKAKWEKRKYTIEYQNLQGGTTGSPTSYSAHDSITLYRAVLDGYKFIGWSEGEKGPIIPFTDKSSKTTVLNDQTGDKVFYAHWDKLTDCVVKFNLNKKASGITHWSTDDISDGKIPVPLEGVAPTPSIDTSTNEMTVPYGTQISSADLPVPENNSLTFEGWYTLNGTTPINGDMVTSEILNLYPKFKGEDDNVSQSVLIEFEQPDKTWSKGISFPLDENSKGKIDVSNLDQKYNVKFGTAMQITTGSIKNLILENPAALRASGITDIGVDQLDGKYGAYDMSHFETSFDNDSAFLSEEDGNPPVEAGSGQNNLSYIVAGDGNAVIKFYRKRINITYMGMDATTWPQNMTVQVPYGGSIYFDSDSVPQGADADTVPYAKDFYQYLVGMDFMDGTRTLKFGVSYETYDDDDGNTYTDTSKPLHVKSISKIPIVFRAGYDFKGWYLGQTNLGGSTDTALTKDLRITQDSSFFQSWVPHTYQIKYNLTGEGTGSAADSASYSPVKNDNPASYTIESNAFTIKEPSRTGYVFDGWTAKTNKNPDPVVSEDFGTTESSLKKTLTVNKGTYGSIELTAHWTPIVYSINYNLNSKFGKLADGTPNTYTIEDVVKIPEATRQGYDFKGWTETSNVEHVISSATKNLTWSHKMGDRAFTATWKPTIDQNDYKDSKYPGYITEPSWNAGNAKSVNANDSVAKDPRLHSTVPFESYGYIEVKIPKILVQMKENGNKVVKDAFKLENIDYQNFILLSKADSDKAGGYCTYLYAYRNTLAANGETPALFTSIRAENYAVLYNDDGTVASDQSVHSSVDVRGIVTSKLAEDDEDMTTVENAYTTRKIAEKSDASNNTKLDIKSMYDMTHMTNGKEEFVNKVKDGETTRIHGFYNSGTSTGEAPAMPIGSPYSTTSLDFDVVGPSSGWEGGSANRAVIECNSSLAVPYGRKCLMKFSIVAFNKPGKLFIDWNAYKDKSHTQFIVDSLGNDGYGTTRVYVDGVEASRVNADSSGWAGISLSQGKFHDIVIVMGNDNPANTSAIDMYSQFGIGFVQLSGRTNWSMNNIHYTLTD